ncbi:MAG: prephenate dehydrogenase/arogenate dehydrogenase family protein [Solirubrobacteraceae bacterium]
MRIAVIGVGLIGGSVALAARKRLGAFVAGYDADPAALRRAQRRGAIDRSCDSIQDAVGDAELAFVAVPVGAQREALAAVLAAAPADCVVSDVGSTKRAIVAQIDDQRFVGGHPLAGAETSGIEHARADLFDGAAWYLTPTQRTAGVRYETLHRVLCAFGAMPSAIDADTHDTILALVSHLPHVLANVLVSQAAATLAAGDQRLPATGPSFRDATRVAGASSAIWTDIYLSNRDTLLAQIDETIRRLDGVRTLLSAGEGESIARWNDAAAADRRLLLDAHVDGGELCELRASVPNRPGVVAELALALGRAGVNIPDMALYPAADMTEGVVALWIAGAGTAARAEQIIHELGFPVARA